MTEGEDVVVGIVGRPWGTRGQFLLNPQGTDPNLLLSSGRLRLRPRGGAEGEFVILKSHFAGGRLVVQVEGCRTPEQAETLRGAEVVLDAGSFAPAPEGGFYPHELAGMTVVLRVGGGLVGRVERVLDTAGADLLVVRRGEKDVLVPFVEAICQVDRGSRTIEIDPPDGLMDLE